MDKPNIPAVAESTEGHNSLLGSTEACSVVDKSYQLTTSEAEGTDLLPSTWKHLVVEQLTADTELE